MSSTLHKIADKLTGKDKHADNPASSNIGPHSSAAANKLDPRVDSDADGRNDPTSHVGGYGGTQTVDTQPATGYYVGSATHTGPGTTHTVGITHHSTNTGPHDSNLANKLDPRVDSDRHGNNIGGGLHGGHGVSHTQTHQHSSTPGYTGSNTAYDNPQSTNTGPHSSNLLNKVDPRVDSDRDDRNDPTSHAGGYGQTQTSTMGHANPTTCTTSSTGGYTGTNTAYDNVASSNTGPHSSNLMNKLDPRVDSDRDGRNDPTSRVGGYGQTQTSTGLGTTVGHTTTGVGGNTAHTTTGAQGYTGTDMAYDNPKSTNTGPHSSNLLNKLDPRVNSDRDGRDDPTSRTGGYGQTQTQGSVGRY